MGVDPPPGGRGTGPIEIFIGADTDIDVLPKVYARDMCICEYGSLI